MKTFYEVTFLKQKIVHNNSFAIQIKNEKELNNWIDIEKEIPKYSNNVFSSKINAKEEFDALKTALMSYLEEAQKGKINESSLAFKMLKEELETTTSIYNFNYTNSIFRVATMLNIDFSF